MEWFDKYPVEGENGPEDTNASFLRALIENLWKAVVSLLNALGEWPIDL